MFIVNNLGAVHSVEDGFKLPEGWKKAGKNEIADWFKMQGLTVEGVPVQPEQEVIEAAEDLAPNDGKAELPSNTEPEQTEEVKNDPTPDNAETDKPGEVAHQRPAGRKR